MTTHAAPPRVRVFIVDDHPIVRESLFEACRATEGLDACGMAGSYEEAIGEIGRLRPDVVVLDLGLKEKSGFDLIRHLREAYPGMQLLVFSMLEETRYALRAIRDGARGYVMKTAPAGDILDAIVQASRGKLVVSDAVQQQLLQNAAEGAPAEATPDQLLSSREWQVFECLGKGLSVMEISDAIHISKKTVNSYCERIKAKLGIPRLRDISRTAHDWFHDHRP